MGKHLFDGRMIRYLMVFTVLLLTSKGWANTLSWPQYENETLGFRLSYPDDFEVEAESNASAFFRQRANGRAYGYAYPRQFSIERDYAQGVCVEKSVAFPTRKKKDVTSIKVGNSIFCRVAYIEQATAQLHVSFSLSSAPTGVKLEYVMEGSLKGFKQPGAVRQDSPMMLQVVGSLVSLRR